MRRKSVDGVLIRWGCMDYDCVDYDEYMIFGDEVLQMINYYEYFNELKGRKCSK